ncbi:MAG: hypothetical protein Q4D61_08835, partial [Cardiobacteriaceae bacterium]|nr:hypothetical protein [Cardiobacteriaceae bacterium]
LTFSSFGRAGKATGTARVSESRSASGGGKMKTQHTFQDITQNHHKCTTNLHFHSVFYWLSYKPAIHEKHQEFCCDNPELYVYWDWLLLHGLTSILCCAVDLHS